MLENVGTVILVGAGKMGMALVRGWLAGGLPTDRLILVDPAPQDSTRQFAEDIDVQLVAECPAGVADVLLLAVKPQIIDKVMAGLGDKIKPDTLVMSIAAGISLATISGAMGTDKVIRTMPNLPAQVGKGVTGVIPGSGASEDDCAVAEVLLSAAGMVVWLDEESDIDALTSLSGSGPAYVFYMVEAMAAAGAAQGLPREAAMVLARQTVIGAAAMMDADPTDAGTLRENVTSPNGVTYEALKILMADDGMEPLLTRALTAARLRSEELGG